MIISDCIITIIMKTILIVCTSTKSVMATVFFISLTANVLIFCQKLARLPEIHAKSSSPKILPIVDLPFQNDLFNELIWKLICLSAYLMFYDSLNLRKPSREEIEILKAYSLALADLKDYYK
ncbi:hypothetical protein ROZALSC1DRAFT_25289 [Rozella allomycis CSF55]|uniref:Uncharacterized protein n=1 Tax=Rozella allomycis (strain CSF55) TaxID=988480 RepID=A0A4P9YBB6_ROZAC|nr:hypothetical protein ROZALSC1DRAFT_25289 [Rozella allomycis CSF55]